MIRLLIWYLGINLATGYKAVVVDYWPSQQDNWFAAVIVKNNVVEYEKLIKKAKDDGADIIVFPEWGLSSHDIANKFSPGHLDGYSLGEVVRNTVPCGNSSYRESLSKLSCAAKNNQIHLVLNLLEKEEEKLSDEEDSEVDNSLYFDTNIAIDRTGRIIAKYRKQHGLESIFVSNKERKVPFDVNFGEGNRKFALFSIQDIYYSEDILKDKSITDVIVTSSWKSTVPFRTTLSVIDGFSKVYGEKNFLVASYKNKNYIGGSGIFSKTGGRNLYVSEIPSTQQPILMDLDKTDVNDDTKITKNSDLFSNENLKNYEVIEKEHEENCCKLDLLTFSTHSNKYKYKLLTHLDVQMINEKQDKIGYSVCALVACKNDSLDSCGNFYPEEDDAEFSALSIKVNRKIRSGDLFIPITLKHNFAPLHKDDYILTKDGGTIEIKINRNIGSLLTFGIIVTNNEHAENFIEYQYDCVDDFSNLTYIIIATSIATLVVICATYFKKKNVIDKKIYKIIGRK